MPIKKYLKHIGIKVIQSKVILDYNKTCDNICQWNLGTVRIYEAKIINNWRKYIKKNIQTEKWQRCHVEN
jgi:hypothetical protein